jgi:hypothetical protein
MNEAGFNQLLVTLIVILLPGIIATAISDKLTVHSKWGAFKFSLYSFVLGMFAYSLLQLSVYAVDYYKGQTWSATVWRSLDVWANIVSDKPKIIAWELVFATVFSLPVALIVSWAINHKIFNKLAQALAVTTKYGDENLFSYYLNAKEVDWIYIRDIEHNLTYQGRIVSSSENERIQELVLSEVTVFRYEDSKELYSVPTMYLAKDAGKYVIEAIPPNLLGVEDGKETIDRGKHARSRKGARQADRRVVAKTNRATSRS